MFKKKQAQAPNSPRAVIRPPMSFDEADPTTVNMPTSPIRSGSSARNLSDSPKSPKQSGPKVLIRANALSIDTDTARTRQELIVGKGVIRPIMSPVEKQKNDFFSRMSFRKLSAPPPPPIEAPKEPPKQEEDTDLDASETSNRPTIAVTLESSNENDVIARIAERRGWGKTFPTQNPHCMHVLLKEANPFKRIRDFTKTSGQELSAALESAVYCSPKNLNTASRHRFRRGDVVVVGCPRSGQTPILQILASLREKSYVSSSDLLERVEWVEGPFKPPRRDYERKIFKTHMPCSLALKGEHGKMVEHKIIMVVRDPADLRLSWYRHVRRIVRKCAHQSIDKNIELGSFANVGLPMPLLPKKEEEEVVGKEPEHSIAGAVRAAFEYPESALIIFYEELLSNPCKVVERIAQFTNGMEPVVEKKRVATSSGGGEEEVEKPHIAEARRKAEAELVVQVATSLMNETCHPNSTKRNGSSGQGSVCFPRAALERFDDLWEQVLPPGRFGTYKSYQHLYQTRLKERYPFAEEKESAGSGGLFQRLSELTSSTDAASKSLTQRKDSSLTVQSNATKLSKHESSNEAEKSLVRARKFGGSFLKFIGNGRTSNAQQTGKGNNNRIPPLPERPVVNNLPRVFFSLDPDDSDSE